MNHSPNDVTIVGTHEFRFVPPDEMHFVMRGEFGERDVEPYLKFIFDRDLSRTHYCVYDLREFTRVTAEGRKQVIHVGRPYPFGALAIIGADFSQRTVAGMILTAGRLVAPKHFTFSHKFVANLSEAQNWFDELRRARS